VPDPTALAKALATSLAPIEYASTKAQTKAQAIRPLYKPGTPTSGLLYLALTATAAAKMMERGRRIRLQTRVPRPRSPRGGQQQDGSRGAPGLTLTEQTGGGAECCPHWHPSIRLPSISRVPHLPPSIPTAAAVGSLGMKRSRGTPALMQTEMALCLRAEWGLTLTERTCAPSCRLQVGLPNCSRKWFLTHPSRAVRCASTGPQKDRETGGPNWCGDDQEPSQVDQKGSRVSKVSDT
jgi:hypothetical protein